MRRAILQLLRCPRCRRGALLSDAPDEELVFGPLRCPACQATFPVAEGVADLVPEVHPPRTPGLLQRGLERPLVARAWERRVRPLLQRGLAHPRIDADSEYLLYRALVGRPEGPLLDLGVGTGLFARRLAREPGMPPVVGMDGSRAMLEESLAQAREAGARVDFVRALAPELPFRDGALGAVLQADSLHLVADLPRLLREVARVLRPGGRYVASAYLPAAGRARVVQRVAGLFPRSEAQLRAAAVEAGLLSFERVVLAPLVLFKAERPAVARAP